MAARMVLGLDIGSRNLKMALLRRNRSGAQLCAFLVREFPSEALEDWGSRESFVVGMVRDFLDRNHVARADVYCCLEAVGMGETILQLPTTSRKELRQAVFSHVKKKVGDDCRSYLFGFHARQQGSREKKRSGVVQLAIVPEEAPKKLVRTLEKLKLRLKGINVWGFAVESLIRRSKFASGRCLAVLDIGAAGGAIGIFHDGRLEFAREISTGGDAFTRALTQVPVNPAGREFLDLSAAEQMKRRYGTFEDGAGAGLGDEQAARLSAMMRPQVERLVLEVKRSVEYHRQSFNSGEVKAVYMCGGGSRLKNLASSIASQLGTPVAPLPIDECIGFWSKSVEQELGDDVVEACLAIGAALDDGRRINLLPKEVTAARKLGEASRFFQVLVMAGLALIWNGRDRARQELPRLRSTVAAGKEAMSLMRNELAKVETLEGLQSELASLERAVAGKKGGVPDWAGLLKELSNTVPESLVLTELASASDSKGRNAVLRGYVVEGVEARNLEVSQFVIRLEVSPFFRNVRLVYPGSGDDGKRARFEIKCRLEY